ncbi:MAG: DEAD/DEAH box helicase [bacterium]
MARMLSYTELLLFLRKHSYQEVDRIHQSGDFVVRGDTVSWWPVSASKAYRFHFFDADLEKMERGEEGDWNLTELTPEVVANEIETEHGTIRPGEYVVHPFHGVGIFERIETRMSAEGEKRFVSLQYAGNDRLLFPYDRYKELMPYIGSRHPRLTRLYSKAWLRTKERIQKDLIAIARQLLQIYAQRQLTEREPFPHAEEWQNVLESQVDFDLTEDQARAWDEMQKDFARRLPMDRLICGDVGFGKTELALRAAAQVIASGKQVALVAPTTVLAEQHYVVLEKRFADLPVKVGHISRLTGTKNQAVLPGLADGSVDLVIGTHRLLGKDVQFKDLGLLILDEEQKFGVGQKERLKELRPSIDVLSLSATPIPRTLSMSLSGLRSLSILRTPPQGRLPVTTEVGPYQDKVLGKAMLAEIKRGGQTYVVHNRVQSLPLVLERVSTILTAGGLKSTYFADGARASTKSKGEVVICMAHGQMGENALAEAMSLFLAGEIDVLVASSIVEYGLDSPSANTLVVLHSEWFGLSDLYQLRGRVGRRRTQAFAYFMVGGVERAGYELQPEVLTTTENARRRLEALMEADTLGSGWSIALRDLEIRGGGNILGHEQHGNMESIGLLLYSQLLQEEIGRQARRLHIPLFHSSEE